MEYTVLWGDEGWKRGTDGYWYHQKPVSPDDVTDTLIRAAYKETVPAGYRLHLQILASAIQAAPDAAVEEAWGVSVVNGEIIPG